MARAYQYCVGMTNYRLTPRGEFVIIGATLAFLIVCGIVATEDTHPAPTFPPCEFEDSPGPCHWNAPARGNLHGVSFVVMPDQTVIYLDK